MNKVSFDFDGTLSREYVQEYAKYLIEKGVEVWICTSRLNPENAPNDTWNDDLFRVSKEVGIPKERIIFTNYSYKYKFLDNSFIWHLDDYWIELKFINTHTKIKGISVFGNSTWKNKCNKLLNLKKNKLK